MALNAVSCINDGNAICPPQRRNDYVAIMTSGAAENLQRPRQDVLLLQL
jgi:hypothetical protein